MKEVNYFICEICGTEYEDKERATECECSHKKTIGIKRSTYLSYESYMPYPVQVEIEMEDGKIVRYKKSER